jgi:hypothetical protein
MKRTGPVFLSLSVIVATLVPLMNNSGNGSMQTAYAQTHAGALATLGASGTANSTTIIPLKAYKSREKSITSTVRLATWCILLLLIIQLQRREAKNFQR